MIEPARPYVHGWHIDVLAEHLEAITSGRYLELGLENRLLVNIPPGTMKSLMMSVLWPAWEWGPCNMPELRYLTTSYNENYVKRDARRMRDLVQSDWYQERWGDHVHLVRSGEISFANDRGGWREGAAFPSLTGGRGDRVIIDDPHSTENAASAAERATAARIFCESVTSRLNDPIRSAIVVIMQRLHVEDISGLILSMGLPYVHLMLPMEFEPERRCTTAIGFADPRLSDGELLFPERFPREVVDRDKIPMGSHGVAGQFQQRPTARGGELVHSQWFGRYAQPPVIKYRVIYADTAQKSGERNDYSVFECWGKGADNKIYLLDLIRGKWEAPELKRRAIAFWNKHKAVDSTKMGELRQMKVEDAASGTGLIQELKSQALIPVAGITRTKDKYTRLFDVLSYIEAGYVMLPESAPFTAEFVAECEAFTADGSHMWDDQVDPMIDAIGDMLAKTNYLERLLRSL